MNLSSKSKATANHPKTEQSETKYQKFLNAPTNFCKRLQSETKTTESTFQDGLMFSYNIQTISTDLTFNNVWCVFYKIILCQLKQPLTKIKSMN